MENCLPYTDEVMVGFVYKCVQQTRHLALQLENIEKHSSSLEHIEWFSYFLRIGDPRGNTLMKMP